MERFDWDEGEQKVRGCYDDSGVTFLLLSHLMFVGFGTLRYDTNEYVICDDAFYEAVYIYDILVMFIVSIYRQIPQSKIEGKRMNNE